MRLSNFTKISWRHLADVLADAFRDTGGTEVIVFPRGEEKVIFRNALLNSPALRRGDFEVRFNYEGDQVWIAVEILTQGYGCPPGVDFALDADVRDVAEAIRNLLWRTEAFDD